MAIQTAPSRARRPQSSRSTGVRAREKSASVATPRPMRATVTTPGANERRPDLHEQERRAPDERDGGQQAPVLERVGVHARALRGGGQGGTSPGERGGHRRIVAASDRAATRPRAAATDAAQGGPALDTWKYYAITHADHVVLNPTSPARLDELIGLLDLPAEPRVLDIGCGTGELLVRLAERHAPWRRRQCRLPWRRRRRLARRSSPGLARRTRHGQPGAAIELLEMDGAAYRGRARAPSTWPAASAPAGSSADIAARCGPWRRADSTGWPGAGRRALLADRADGRVPRLVRHVT